MYIISTSFFFFSIEGQLEPVAAGLLFGEENPWFQDMAEHLHLNDPAMLTAAIEFEQMHEAYDYERLFPQISRSLLIIQGSPSHGGLLTDEEVEHALALLPSATVAKMETVGHTLHTQEKEPVLLAINAFLKEAIALRDQAQLLHHPQIVADGPVLGDLAVRDTKDVNLLYCVRLTSRGNSQEHSTLHRNLWHALMCSAYSEAAYHFVSCGEYVLNGILPIRKRRQQAFEHTL